MRIDQLMSQPIFSCGLHDTLARAAELMQEHDCGVVTVVNEHGKLLGILTDRDICMTAYSEDSPLSSIEARNAMTQSVHRCKRDDSIEHAEKLMAEHQISRIPVVDSDDKPIGLLSIHDLARHAASTGHNQRQVLETMAAIVEQKHMSLKTP